MDLSGQPAAGQGMTTPQKLKRNDVPNEDDRLDAIFVVADYDATIRWFVDVHAADGLLLCRCRASPRPSLFRSCCCYLLLLLMFRERCGLPVATS